MFFTYISVSLFCMRVTIHTDRHVPGGLPTSVNMHTCDKITYINIHSQTSTNHLYTLVHSPRLTHIYIYIYIYIFCSALTRDMYIRHGWFYHTASKVHHPRCHRMTATPCGVGNISLSMQHEIRHWVWSTLYTYRVSCARWSLQD